MRTVVPAILSLVSALLFSSPALSASAGDLPSLAASLAGSCTTTPSGSGSEQEGCRAQTVAFCQNFPGASGCSSRGSSGRSFSPEFGSGQSKSAFASRADQVERSVQNDANQARQCCGNGESCAPERYGFNHANGVHQAVQSQRKNGSRGMHNDAGAHAQALDDSANHNAVVGGICRGLRSVCQQKYQMMAKKLRDQDPCKSGDSECRQEAQDRQQKYESAAGECASLDSSRFEQSARDLDQANKQAQNTQGSTADSGTSPGGGAADTGKGGQEAMQALGKMLPMAMAAMQAMNQGQDDGNQDQQMPFDNMMQPQMGMPQQPANNPAQPQLGDAGIPVNTQGQGNFNLGDSGDIPRLPTDIADRNGVAGTPPTVRGITGGGGSMPGGQGGGGASIGGGGGGGGPGYKPTNVQLGEASGASGFSKIANDMSLQNGGGGGGYSYGGGGDGGFDKMNLAEFLPGGRQDPSRARGPAGLAGNGQIQGKSVNIWNRISEKMRNRCAQGLLRDCGL